MATILKLGAGYVDGKGVRGSMHARHSDILVAWLPFEQPEWSQRLEFKLVHNMAQLVLGWNLISTVNH